MALLLLILILWFIEKWGEFRKAKRRQDFYAGNTPSLRVEEQKTATSPPNDVRIKPLTMENSTLPSPVPGPRLALMDSKAETSSAPQGPPPGMRISQGQLRACTVLQNKLGLPLRWNDRSQSWNKNPKTGRNLELDCWSPEKKIALEFQGNQHNVFPNRFHKTREEFEDSIRRDLQKRENCKKNGVYLIEVLERMKADEAEAYINLHVGYWIALQQEQQTCELVTTNDKTS